MNVPQWIQDLRAARPDLLIVAEMKDHSPYGFVNRYGFSDQLDLCIEAGDIISVHTDPLWGGSFDLLSEVCRICRATNKRVLAKGFHPTIPHVERAFGCGAAFVLTVGWHPSYIPRSNDVWHECESTDELAESGAMYRVWNTRNPRTGERRVAPLLLDRAMTKQVFAAPMRIQASNIRCVKDVHPQANGVIIGEGLYT